MPGCQKCPGYELEHIIGTITKSETRWCNVIFCSEFLAQLICASVRIVIDVSIAMLNGLERLITGAQRILIGCQLDGIGDSKFSLEFLYRLTRQVRPQLLYAWCSQFMEWYWHCGSDNGPGIGAQYCHHRRHVFDICNSLGNIRIITVSIDVYEEDIFPDATP